MAKKMKLLSDPRHWVGWILSAGVLVGVFYFLPESIMSSLPKIFGVTLLTLTAVDLFKHKVDLQ